MVAASTLAYTNPASIGAVAALRPGSTLAMVPSPFGSPATSTLTPHHPTVGSQPPPSSIAPIAGQHPASLPPASIAASSTAFVPRTEAEQTRIDEVLAAFAVKSCAIAVLMRVSEDNRLLLYRHS